MECWTAPTKIGAINDVIMDQNGGMKDLHSGLQRPNFLNVLTVATCCEIPKFHKASSEHLAGLPSVISTTNAVSSKRFKQFRWSVATEIRLVR